MSKPTKLPEGWKLVSLGEVGTLINGDRGKNYPSQKDFVDNGVPFINAGHIQNGEIDFESMNFISRKRFDLLGSGKVKSGDILYCLRGSLGKTAIIKDIQEGAIASSLVIIRPSEQIRTDYFYRYLASPIGQAEIYKYDNGSSQPNLSAQSLKQYQLPLPPLEEQRRIAAILDKADGVRRKRKEAIRLTEELLKSTFLEMFGDPVTNPKGWEVRELGDCVKDIESGWSPKCDTRQAEPEEWGVLKLGAVTYGHFNPDENKAMLPDDVPRQELEIKTGDLLVTRKNTYELVGASAFVQMTRPKLMLPDLIFRLRLIDGIDPVYVWQTLSQKTMRLKLSGLAGGTAGSMPNISKARLRTLPFPVPPQLLQLKYREIFNQFWLKKEHQKESEEISENLFNSLLQRAFRGEL